MTSLFLGAHRLLNCGESRGQKHKTLPLHLVINSEKGYREAWASQVAVVGNSPRLPPVQETQDVQVQWLGLERPPEGGHSSSGQYFCLGNPMDRGNLVAYRAAKSWKGLKRLSMQTCIDRNKNTKLLLRAVACMAGKLVVYGGQERKVEQVTMEESICMHSPTLPVVIQVCQLKPLKKLHKGLIINHLWYLEKSPLASYSALWSFCSSYVWNLSSQLTKDKEGWLLWKSKPINFRRKKTLARRQIHQTSTCYRLSVCRVDDVVIVLQKIQIIKTPSRCL